MTELTVILAGIVLAFFLAYAMVRISLHKLGCPRTPGDPMWKIADCLWSITLWTTVGAAAVLALVWWMRV